jgi:hypothetical protein
MVNNPEDVDKVSREIREEKREEIREEIYEDILDRKTRSSGEEFIVGDFVYLSGEILQVNPRAFGQRVYEDGEDELFDRSLEKIYRKDFARMFGPMPVLLGSPYVPKDFTKILLGESIGNSGKTEFKPFSESSVNEWEKTPLTTIRDFTTPPVAETLENAGIESGWELVTENRSKIAEILEKDNKEVRAIQKEVAEHLDSRRLLQWEVVDAYRWQPDPEDSPIRS